MTDSALAEKLRASALPHDVAEPDPKRKVNKPIRRPKKPIPLKRHAIEARERFLKAAAERPPIPPKAEEDLTFPELVHREARRSRLSGPTKSWGTKHASPVRFTPAGHPGTADGKVVSINSARSGKGSGLPQAKDLIPFEDAQDAAILRRHNPGALPKNDLDVSKDPAVLEAERVVAEAQKALEETTRRQTILRLIDSAEDLDPDRVAEYCEQERWKAGELLYLSRDAFGFIPEKFEFKALEHPEGSPERDTYMRARDEARLIYGQQIKQDLYRTSKATVDKAGSEPRDKRAALEHVSTMLWSFYKREKFEGNPVWKYQGARILWAALNVNEILERAKSNEEFSKIMGLKDVTPDDGAAFALPGPEDDVSP